MAFKTTREMLSRQTALRQRDQDFDYFAKMQLPMVGLSDTLTSRLRSFRGKRIHQIAMWSVNYPQRQVSLVSCSEIEEASLWNE